MLAKPQALSSLPSPGPKSQTERQHAEQLFAQLMANGLSPRDMIVVTTHLLDLVGTRVGASSKP